MTSDTFWRIKNWNKFQHYKDRKPPWIKLHRDILDDQDFHSLPVESRAVLPLLWLLAAESRPGIIEIGLAAAAWRLHMKPSRLERAINPLINKGFIEKVASNMISECNRDATPETETETETEKNKPGPQNSRPVPHLLSELKKTAKVKTMMTASQQRYADVAKLKNEALRLFAQGMKTGEMKERLKEWAANNAVEYSAQVVSDALDVAEAAMRDRKREGA